MGTDSSLPYPNIIIIEGLCSPMAKDVKPEVLHLASRQTLDCKAAAITITETSKKVQQGKLLASKPEDRSSNPRTYTVGREK